MNRLLTITLGVFAPFFLLSIIAQQRFVGGDISLLPTYESNGAWYNDENKEHIADMLDYLKQQGLNSMRVRLFVDPSKAHQAHKMQGVRQDLAYVKALGKRIKDAGFSFMLDFHYSDTWADPGKQFTPDAWLSLDDDQMAQKLYDYTSECLQELKAAGATPDFIQTGNEISYGMLWGKGVKTKDTYDASTGKGEVTYSNNASSYKQCFYDSNHEANWQRFYKLLKQAGKACREVCPNARIILHSERVPHPANVADFCNRMLKNGVDFDIIGLSYYPYHHGSLNQLGLALDQTKQFDKDVMIVETGYYYAWEPATVATSQKSTWPITPQGQAAFTKDLIAKLKSYDRVIGMYWWQMESTENGITDWYNKRVTDGWYNASLFNDTDGSIWGNGQVMPAMKELKFFAVDAASISTVGTESVRHQWYSPSGIKYNSRPLRTGLYIHDGRKVYVK